jgi:hypothetical protein
MQKLKKHALIGGILMNGDPKKLCGDVIVYANKGKDACTCEQCLNAIQGGLEPGDFLCMGGTSDPLLYPQKKTTTSLDNSIENTMNVPVYRYYPPVQGKTEILRTDKDLIFAGSYICVERCNDAISIGLMTYKTMLNEQLDRKNMTLPSVVHNTFDSFPYHTLTVQDILTKYVTPMIDAYRKKDTRSFEKARAEFVKGSEDFQLTREANHIADLIKKRRPNMKNLDDAVRKYAFQLYSNKRQSFLPDSQDMQTTFLPN